MKIIEVRPLPNEELVHRLEELKTELFNLRFQLATGQLDNYKRVGIVKRDIARIATVLHEREMGIEVEPKEAPKPRRIRRRRREPDETEDSVPADQVEEEESPDSSLDESVDSDSLPEEEE